MKRKITAFPQSTTSCSLVETTVFKPRQVSRIEEAVDVENLKDIDLKILTSCLPCNHENSISLTNQVDDIFLKPEGLISVRVVSTGLVEIIIRSGFETGYGCCSWKLLIGGMGMGIDGEILRAPVAVRFAAPISHIHVDDIGFVDDTFWSKLSKVPSLLDIINNVIDLLKVPACSDHDDSFTRKEQERWLLAQSHNYGKLVTIKQYKTLASHQELISEDSVTTNDWKIDWFHPSFVAMISALKGDPSNGIWRQYIEENSPGIFSFDMLSASFCNMFIEEIDNYELSNLPRRRPNTMNNYGLIVNEIGMYPLFASLLENWLCLLMTALYPSEPVAYGLDHHHTFIVQYRAQGTGDKDLDMHHDSSEVTLNVCLGRQQQGRLAFQGGGLRFCGHAGASNHRKLQYTYEHLIGRAVVHLGRHRHGADDVLIKETDPVAAAEEEVDTIDIKTMSTILSESKMKNHENMIQQLLPSIENGSFINVDASNDERSSEAIRTTVEDRSSSSNKTGERINLIMWLRSSVFRAAAAYGHIHPDGFPRLPEQNEPDRCCLSIFNDDDYNKQIKRIADIAARDS